MQPLPLRDFRELSSKEVAQFDLDPSTWHLDGDVGFWLCIDIDIPTRLHKRFAGLPPLAERKKLTYDMLSPWTKHVMEIQGRTPRNKDRWFEERLVTDLTNKKEYWIHWKHLHSLLRWGLVLKKCRGIVSFYQTDFVSKYLKICILQRKLSSSKFYADLFKLASNGVFGKFIEVTKEAKRKKNSITKVNLNFLGHEKISDSKICKES